MFAPDEKPELGEAPPKPEGAQWAPPLEVITDITYRADGAGYLKPGYTHVYVVAADGGAPRQLTFGAFNEAARCRGRATASTLLVTGNRSENWQREPVNTELYRVSLADGAIQPLTSATVRTAHRPFRRTASSRISASTTSCSATRTPSST